MAHEGDRARTPSLQWLGCHSDDMVGHSDQSRNVGICQMSQRDQKKAVNMLQWPFMAEDWIEPRWRRELQIMLMLGHKFEIEMIEDIQARLRLYMDSIGD